MATYAFPTQEQQAKRAAVWRAVIQRTPTWQLSIWLACPRSAAEEAMIREELTNRDEAEAGLSGLR